MLYIFAVGRKVGGISFCRFRTGHNTPMRKSRRKLLNAFIGSLTYGRFFYGGKNLYLFRTPGYSGWYQTAFNFFAHINYADTVFLDGPETVPRRFAIDKRNRLMLEWADTVITYVCHPGGAAKFKALAEKKQKQVINLGTPENGS